MHEIYLQSNCKKIKLNKEKGVGRMTLVHYRKANFQHCFWYIVSIFTTCYQPVKPMQFAPGSLSLLGLQLTNHSTAGNLYVPKIQH